MNRRLCVRIGSALGCVALWHMAGGDGATASAVPPVGAAPAVVVAPLTPAVTLVANANTPGTVAQVSGFIGTALASLQSTDGPTAAAARAALVASCPRAASPSFHAVFTTQLCNAALAVLAKSPPMPVKVNLGVVMTAVGSNAQTTQLDRAVQVLLADRSDGVALAGIHAAQPLVVALITQPGGPGKTALFAAVVNAVRTHSTGDFAGFMAVDAYRALVVKPDNVPGIPIAAVRPLLRPLYDPVMDLLAFRVQQYAKGVVPNADAEAIVPTFLTRDFPTVPPLMSTAQQQRAVQLLVNLLDAIGQRSGPVADRAVLTQLRESVRTAAGGLNVMSRTTLLSTAAGLPPGVTGPAMAAACSTAYSSMSIPFKGFTVYAGGPTLFANGLAKPPTLPAVAPPVVPPAAAPPPPARP